MSRHHGILISILLLPHITVQSSYVVTSCVDPETPSSISSWKSTLPHRITQMNGSSGFSFEGPSNSGVEFELKYGEKLRPTQRVYLYVEYLNESPRRLVVQPVKNEEGSDFNLLPGVNGINFDSAFAEIDVAGKGEPSITGILKKPQKITIRKLVLFTLPSNSRESISSITAQLNEKSCKRITTPVPTPPTSHLSSPQQPTQRPQQTTCGTSTECTTCPECKCNCNCLCRQQEC